MTRAFPPPALGARLGRRSLLAVAAAVLGACVPQGDVVRDLSDADAAIARGRAALEAGDPGLAAEWFARAGALSPEDALPPALEGEMLYRLGRLGQAEAPLRRAVELDPALAPAWNNLGLVLLDQGRPTEAARALEIAFGLDSGATDAIRRNLQAAMAARETEAYDPVPSRTVVPVVVPTGVSPGARRP